MALTDFEVAPAARRTLTVFILADCSGSMSGEKIAALNDGMRNAMPILRDIAESNADAEIKLAVCSFADQVKWLNEGPMSVETMEWKDLTSGGSTSMGGACRELNAKLSHHRGFLKSASACFAPVLILMGDGAPTDDFKGGMAALKENNWYRHATKIALAIGNDADTKVLAEFTGDLEMVFKVHNVDALRTCIKTLVVTSSMINSQSASAGIGASEEGGAAIPTKAEQTAQELHRELANVPGVDMAQRAVDVSIDPDEFD